MTAEIAIINKSAIALAADSKVTLTRGGKQKTYDTVNKLFTISKSEPVGAMIYGNAEFMEFPWETIIKEYRRQKPRKRFDTVFDWADDLLAFLTGFFPFTEGDENDLVARTASGAMATITNRYIEFVQAHGDVPDFADGLRAEFQLHIDRLEAFADYFSAQEWQVLGPRLAPVFDSLCANGIPAMAPELQATCRNFAELTIRKAVASSAHSGLVVAGFGEKELLPSLVSFEIDGIIGGRLKGLESVRFDATRKSHGLIRPFAQSDMVFRFMEGIDPEYAAELEQGISKLLVDNAVKTAQALGQTKAQTDAMLPAFQAATDAALKEFVQSSNQLRRNRFAQPIIEMTMSLPKDELAHLAESLVSLTSLQRRVSREIETVGGAIDVAVISKGDGFVWIKRKHYFSADRNLRFVNGYLSEYEGEGQGDEDGDE